jgi:hypothetical protein
MTDFPQPLPPTHQQQGIDMRLERDTMRLERTVTDMRVEVAAGLAGINARLDASKDHEPRLRDLENRISNQLTREDVADMLKQAIESARRPAWRDVGMLITAIATSSGLVLTVAKVTGM